MTAHELELKIQEVGIGSHSYPITIIVSNKLLFKAGKRNRKLIELEDVFNHFYPVLKDKIDISGENMYKYEDIGLREDQFAINTEPSLARFIVDNIMRDDYNEVISEILNELINDMKSNIDTPAKEVLHKIIRKNKIRNFFASDNAI